MKNVNVISSLCFLGQSCRIVAIGASIGDALALTALGGLVAFIHYLEIKKEAPINDNIKAEIEGLKSSMNALKMVKVMSNR
jgi:hypothetical protein